ncbi:catalase [Streptomyces thinghirensis]|nr:catalase [Streptomyces thinghirensis]
MYPSWTLHVQLMPVAEAANYRFNPFDVTKVWPHADYPLKRVGRLVLDLQPGQRLRRGRAGRVLPEQLRSGHRPLPDKMLQGRLFAYADAHRYRLGVNHTQLAVNAPKAVPGGADNYGRDGLMAANAQGRGAKNYEPNSYDGPVETGRPLAAPLAVSGHTGTHEAPQHTKDDDFFQAGELFRLMSEDEKKRLIANIAGGLSQVSRNDVVEKNLAHFHAADTVVRQAMWRRRSAPCARTDPPARARTRRGGRDRARGPRRRRSGPDEGWPPGAGASRARTRGGLRASAVVKSPDASPTTTRERRSGPVAPPTVPATTRPFARRGRKLRPAARTTCRAQPRALSDGHHVTAREEPSPAEKRRMRTVPHPALLGVRRECGSAVRAAT